MKLVAFFSLDAALLPDGRMGLTRKIVEGIEHMARRWPGEVVAVFAPRHEDDTNLDPEPVQARGLPFSVVVDELSGESLDALLADAALVQIGFDYRHLRVARACRAARRPFVMVAEYTLRTRLQIAGVEEMNIARRARRVAWEISQEAQQRQAILVADGLQCNGTPAYAAWAHLNRNPLLFFDSRVQPEMLAGADDVARRGTRPMLSLAFSGRFVPMKGVLHLPDVAHHLRAREIPFKLRLFGGGPLEEALRARIHDLGLERHVTLEGTLPFPELMRVLRADTDLFVCPHVQGDPSCTYVEVMACGVPIAGFDNDAWRGLQERAGSGWCSPLGDAEALAACIAGAHERREELVAHAERALRFAAHHTFEDTFARRMDHLRAVATARRPSFADRAQSGLDGLFPGALPRGGSLGR